MSKHMSKCMSVHMPIHRSCLICPRPSPLRTVDGGGTQAHVHACTHVLMHNDSMHTRSHARGHACMHTRVTHARGQALPYARVFWSTRKNARSQAHAQAHRHTRTAARPGKAGEDRRGQALEGLGRSAAAGAGAGAGRPGQARPRAHAHGQVREHGAIPIAVSPGA